jgi:hypothetical protein
MFVLPMHCRENQAESSEHSRSRRQHGPNMAMRRVHMEPITRRTHGTHLRLCALQSRELYYRSRDHPNAHELTNHIRHPSPALGLRAPGGPEKALRMLCGIVPVSPTGTKEVCPGYSEWERRTGSVFCSQARTPHAIQQTPTILHKSKLK